MIENEFSLTLTDDFSITDTVTVNGLRVLASSSGADHMYLSLNHITLPRHVSRLIRVGDVSFLLVQINCF